MNQESPTPHREENLLAPQSFPSMEVSGVEFDKKFDELLTDDSADDLDEDFEDELASEIGRRQSRKRKGMYCFHCHRQEGHFLASGSRWYYSFLIGMTFGLIRLVGPFQCLCCGAKRLMFADWANLRFLMRDKGVVANSKAPRSRRSRDRTASKER